MGNCIASCLILNLAKTKTELMKLLLDIPDHKANFMLELIKSFRFVKSQTITPAKAQEISTMIEAIEEVKLAKQGKVKLEKAEDLLNEL
jgi:hypothetical protein